MSVELTVIEGRPAVEIVAADGEVWSYWFQLQPSVAGVFGVRLTKLEEGQQMETYHVLLYPSGAWDCDCAHARFRRGKANEAGGCKHSRAVQELQKLLQAMQQCADAPSRA